MLVDGALDCYIPPVEKGTTKLMEVGLVVEFKYEVICGCKHSGI